MSKSKFLHFETSKWDKGDKFTQRSRDLNTSSQLYILLNLVPYTYND